MLPRTGSKGGGKKVEFVLSRVPVIQSQGTIKKFVSYCGFKKIAMTEVLLAQLWT